jgi:hypothetical protein
MPPTLACRNAGHSGESDFFVWVVVVSVNRDVLIKRALWQAVAR